MKAFFRFLWLVIRWRWLYACTICVCGILSLDNPSDTTFKRKCLRCFIRDARRLNQEMAELKKILSAKTPENHAKSIRVVTSTPEIRVWAETMVFSASVSPIAPACFYGEYCDCLVCYRPACKNGVDGDRGRSGPRIQPLPTRRQNRRSWRSDLYTEDRSSFWRKGQSCSSRPVWNWLHRSTRRQPLNPSFNIGAFCANRGAIFVSMFIVSVLKIRSFSAIFRSRLKLKYYACIAVLVGLVTDTKTW